MDVSVLFALAEPNRLQIVELLRDRPHSVNEIAAQLHLRQPQASKHLHKLGSAGLVVVHHKAQQRIYALAPEPFAQLDAWLGSFARHWDTRFNRLDAYLEESRKDK